MSQKFTLNEFYCLNCGELSMSLPRPRGKQHEKFHKKLLYCPKCKIQINHVEVRNDAERIEFFDLYEAGKFETARNESLNFVSQFGSGVL